MAAFDPFTLQANLAGLSDAPHQAQINPYAQDPSAVSGTVYSGTAHFTHPVPQTLLYTDSTCTDPRRSSTIISTPPLDLIEKTLWLTREPHMTFSFPIIFVRRCNANPKLLYKPFPVCVVDHRIMAGLLTLQRYCSAAANRTFPFSGSTRHQRAEVSLGVWVSQLDLQSGVKQRWIHIRFETIGR